MCHLQAVLYGFLSWSASIFNRSGNDRSHRRAVVRIGVPREIRVHEYRVGLAPGPAQTAALDSIRGDERYLAVATRIGRA
jgi:hypothetical protein